MSKAPTPKTKTLPEFIQAVGDDMAADMFDVEPRTAASWRRLERRPRREQAKQIVLITAKHPDGPVTLEGIYA